MTTSDKSTTPGVVVLAWTPDEFGEVAVEHALAEAASRGARVIAVNGTKGDALVDQRFAGGDALGKLEARLAAAASGHEVRQVVGGDVGDEIVSIADELDAELVVVALRRRTPVGKLLMGSVSQRILLQAHCPVLAVKPGSKPRV